MKKVAVVFGGNGCEREVSIITGTLVCNVLRGGKYDVVPFFLDERGEGYTAKEFFDISTFQKGEFLQKAKRVTVLGGALHEIDKRGRRCKKLFQLDGAINCCHGGFGEGGGVSGWLEMQGVPLASPAVAPSSVCMDKALTKLVAKALSIPVVDGVRVGELDYQKRGAFLLKNMERRLKFPVIVKPAHLGSSIGISIAKNVDEVKTALSLAFELDNCAVIEKFLTDKKDVNCAAYSLGGEVYVSEAETAFFSHDGVYGFDEKYIQKPKKDGGRSLSNIGERVGGGGGRELLTGALRQKIRGYTKTLYKRLNMRGVVRVDYLVQGENVYLSEINTVPGSLAYYLFCDRLSEAKAFFEGVIDDAIARAEKERKLSPTTGVLETAVK